MPATLGASTSAAASGVFNWIKPPVRLHVPVLPSKSMNVLSAATVRTPSQLTGLCEQFQRPANWNLSPPSGNFHVATS